MDGSAVNTPAADVDVVVIGAGFGGLTMLYRLRERGFSMQGVEMGDRGRRHLVLEPLSRRAGGHPERRIFAQHLARGAGRVDLDRADGALQSGAGPLRQLRRRPAGSAAARQVQHPRHRDDLGRGQRDLAGRARRGRRLARALRGDGGGVPVGRWSRRSRSCTASPATRSTPTGSPRTATTSAASARAIVGTGSSGVQATPVVVRGRRGI